MWDDKSSCRQILLVDDDHDDLMIFSLALSELDIPTEILYAEGYQTLMKFMENPKTIPQIIFLDINMPGYDGMDCLKLIKSSRDFDSIPIVMYSTSSNPKTITESRLNGASLYLVKPTSFERIKSLLNKILTINWAGFLRNADRFVFE